MTPRQKEVYDMLIAQVPITTIKLKLGISRTSVYDHRDKLIKKGYIKKTNKRGIYIAK